jgi:NADPH:quinone reductase-like Zn-dependent oxidoreductase
VGIDCAGTVEAVGKDVMQFKPGDDVFGGKAGALAEYLSVPADGGIALKPANVTFEQAAGVQVAGCTALQALRDTGKVRPGQNVLINGASGGVGTFAVQIAKSFGAQVTGVCSTRNVELVRSLGADHVIDYTKDDFTKNGGRYDVIIDNVGTQPLSGFRDVLKPKGIYIMIGAGGPDEGGLIGPMGRLMQASLMSPFISQKMGMMMAKVSQSDLKVLADLMQSGKVTTVIDQTYPLSEVREAVRYLETGRARGKVIVAIAQDDKRFQYCRASVSDATDDARTAFHRNALQI